MTFPIELENKENHFNVNIPFMASLVAQSVKNLPAMQETQV